MVAAFDGWQAARKQVGRLQCIAALWAKGQILCFPCILTWVLTKYY